MRFRQLDRIVEVEPGVQITAERTLSGRDVFFQDHFPQFPVLPGVLMLEAMYQACDWLVRVTDAFAHAVVLLKETRGLKFSGFVRPGQTLTVTAQLKKLDDPFGRLTAEIRVAGEVVASARLVVERFNLADRFSARAATDPVLRWHKRAQYRLLEPQSPQPQPVAPTGFRWMWLDRFTEFIRGQRARAIKTVSMTDEPIDLYMPGFPLLPCSLIIEGLAQAGGILLSERKGFEEHAVLAKISKAVFHRPALPGDTMTYTAELESVASEGATVRGTSVIAGEPHAEVELVFANLGDRLGNIELMTPTDALGMLRLYGLYDVGRTAQGDPLEVPPRLLTAERAQFAEGASGGG